MKNPCRRKWIVVMVGQESGRRTPVTFLRFYRREKADEWISRQHDGGVTDELIRYEVESR